VRAEPEEVFVTSGTQQAIDLAARVLLAPGDLVAVEDPCYRPPAMLFRSLHLRVAGVPVDDEGLVVDAIPTGVRLVYVTPSHQFPLGMSLSTRRRRQLLDWADRTGAVIVEDDYDTEFRYGGRPLEPLQSLDRSWRVLYVGSFSKTLLPTLRLGFLLAPPSLRPALRTAKLVTDWHTSGPMQAALAEFISSGAFARHIRRMRRTYAERHQLVVSIVDSEFADCLVRIPSAAGIHVTGLLRPEVGRTDDEIVRLALRRGVDVSLPVSALAVTGPPRHGLVIGYGAVPTDRIPEGLRRLRECVS
jgi:GntR family transcriptional regulator/MocR family aminotransferase